MHHSRETDTIESNPWKLQVWHNVSDNKTKGQLRNLVDEDDRLQDRLVQLLSMFEVSFTARQRKNYLLYCLLYLINNDKRDVKDYADFMERLADSYLHKIYLKAENLNEINTPKPNSFDGEILKNGRLELSRDVVDLNKVFIQIYGDESEK